MTREKINAVNKILMYIGQNDEANITFDKFLSKRLQAYFVRFLVGGQDLTKELAIIFGQQKYYDKVVGFPVIGKKDEIKKQMVSTINNLIYGVDINAGTKEAE